MKKIAIADIGLIVYDFDGVMTDNTVLVGQDGREAVRVNRADGLGVSAFRQRGIPQIIISTEANPVVRVRAKKLGLFVINDCRDKKRTLLKYCKSKKIKMGKVLYVGNDVNDLEVMRVVGHTACPSDAHAKIKRIADVVTRASGGKGVIRELTDLLGIV